MMPPGPLEIGIILAFGVLISLLFFIALAVFLLIFIKQTIRNQVREEILRFQEEMNGQDKK